MAIQRTLSIIKPDATKRDVTGKINQMLENSGLRIVAQKRIKLSQDQAEGFYSVHKERPFYNDLVNFMMSGPVIVQVLEGENAKTRKNLLIAAGNHKIAQIFHPIVLIFFSFIIFIKSKFDRRETNTNIIKLTLGIIAFQILDFFIASQAQSNLTILGFLYLLPLAFLLILIYLLKMTYQTVGD